MNCFQKSYLWLLNTTSSVCHIHSRLLWIAFKNLIFDYWTQLVCKKCGAYIGCELLSKILSLTIEHNKVRLASHTQTVVNCFQKSYLWLLNTTRCMPALSPLLLWIAFKNLIFDYWTQLVFTGCPSLGGCELLSKILSLTIEHNECP